MNWLFVFLGFSLLILVHEGGHFFAAKATGMRVERFFLFFGPTIFSFRRGETEYGVKAIPLGGYVKITGMTPEEEVPSEHEHRAYYRQPVWKRLVVIGAGPAVNIVLAFALLAFVFLTGAQQVTQSVGSVRAGTPASRALQPGDEILAVDGHRFAGLGSAERSERFSRQVSRHRCAGKQTDGCLAAAPVNLLVRRDGRIETIAVRPRYDGAEKRPLIGFSYATAPRPVGIGTALAEAADRTWLVTRGTAGVFLRLFEEDQREKVSGIVGVSDVANQTIEIGLYPSLLLLALVSLSLGLINLLPILPLDGGHIFWAIVEKLRGRPVSVRVMERASVVGFALILMLFVLGLSNDIGRLSGGGFQVR